MRFSFLIICLSLFSSILLAQRKKERDTSAYIEQTDRVEFEIGRFDQEFNIISGKEEGLLLVKETAVRNQNGYGWELIKLDTSLNIEWQKLVVIPFNYDFQGWDYDRGKFYLLYTKSNYAPQDLVIFEVEEDSGEYEEIELSTVFPLYLSHFEVLANTVLLAGSTNFRPAVITYDLDERKPKVLPGIYNGKSDLVDIEVDKEAGVFTVLMLERLVDKRFTISVKTFTVENVLIQSNLIDPVNRNSLIDATTTSFKGGFQYYAGTFSNRNTQYSRGLYLSRFVNGNQQFIKYIDYADLENFWEYMNDGREKRVRNRIKRKESKGKKAKFSYKILIHDIIQRGDEFLLIGEAYYIRYSNYQTMSTPAYGAVPQPFTGVSGYKYTHAIVVAFSPSGEMLWDHSFPIEDAFNYSLKEYVNVDVQENSIELLYLEKNTIRSKIIVDNKVEEGKTYTPIMLPSESDKVRDKDPEIEGLEKWYESTHFAYGEHTIERNTIGKKRRDVFYINKIRYNMAEFTD
jgi:hypothetical protein